MSNNLVPVQPLILMRCQVLKVNLEVMVRNVQDALLPSTYMCAYLLQVSFIGEDGDDSGGLTRKFFTLLPKEILNKYMEPTGVFQHNAVALQVKTFT